MAAQQFQTGGAVERLSALVSAYARRVSSAVLEQQRAASVSSALGVWLLLAACVSAAQGSDRAALEDALGCPAEEAARLLAAFMADPPEALHAGIALWVAVDDATAELSSWTRGLPGEVESGFMPSQAEADAWADHATLGLIRRFPMEIDADTRIVLASALATKVTWEAPFEVVEAATHCGPASPWRGTVSRLLWDGHPGNNALIARTDAAGLVAVHLAVAQEDLTVVSVSGAPDVDRACVVAGAYEIAAAVPEEWERAACSLYDLPLGPGHSWEISEQEVSTYVATPRLERIAGVALPAWEAESEFDLTSSPAFGTVTALHVLRELIGPRPDDECRATQAAVASFTRYGFEAAAVTTFAAVASALRVAAERSVERTAVLRFDHPFAAVAVAGRPGSGGAASPQGTAFAGLPLFSAWVADPIEPEDQAPESSR